MHLLLLLITATCVEPAVRVATSNWHSFNILSKVVKTELVDAGIAVEEVYFDSLGEAFEAMWNGTLDVISETGPCANHADCSTGFCARDTQCHPCNECTSCSTGIDHTCSPACSPCSTPAPVAPSPLNVASHQWGYSMTEGIFLPNYMANLSSGVSFDWRSATSWTGAATLSNNVLELIGPLQKWSAYQVVNALADPGVLDLTVTTPSSASDLQRTVLDHLMWENRFAFYFFAPHLLTTEYPVSQVALPQKQTGGAYFTTSPRRMIWRANIDAAAASVLQGITWSLSDADVRNAISNIVQYVSMALEEKESSYRELMRVSANKLLCEHGGKNDKCADITPRFWPRQKEKEFPETVIVNVHECSGFAECEDEDGNTFDTPKSGYALDHAKEILRLIGYNESEIIFQCDIGTTHQSVLLVARELVDIGHGCITVTAGRQPLVDFSSAFYSSGLSIAIRRSSAEEMPFFEKLMYLMNSGFDTTTWLVLCASALLLMLWVGASEEFHTQRIEAARTTTAERRFAFLSVWIKAITRKPVQLVLRSIGTGAQVLTGSKDTPDLRSHWARFGSAGLATLGFFALSVYAANLTAVKTQELRADAMGLEWLRGRRAAITCGTATHDWVMTHERSVKPYCVKKGEKHEQAVLEGRAEALIRDTPLAEYLVANEGGFELSGTSFAAQDYGMMFPKSSPLLKPVSEAITHLREQEEWHAESYKKHFRGPFWERNAKEAKAKAEKEDEDGGTQSFPLISVIGLMIPALVVILVSRLAVLSDNA